MAHFQAVDKRALSVVAIYTYRLRSITSSNTARKKVLQITTLQAVRAMLSVFRGIL
jgi:hypothetical protein